MNFYRIPATLQAAKTAALAGAKVSALREHLEKDGRYVMHDKGKFYYYSHNKLIAELDIYFNAVPKEGYFVCDKDVSEFIECKPLIIQIEKSFFINDKSYQYCAFHNGDGKWEFDSYRNMIEIRADINELRKTVASINDIINWMESLNNPVKEISLKEVPPASSSPSSTWYSTVRQAIEVIDSSFIRQVASQFYQGKNTISFRFKHPDGTPRSGCIIYDVTGNEYLWDAIKTCIETGDSLGRFYNSTIKHKMPVLETTLSEDV